VYALASVEFAEMRILVTGAAGFVGSHVVDGLLSQGHQVVGLDSFHDFYDPEIKERNIARAPHNEDFRMVRGDIRDPDSWARLSGEFQAVIHLAARAGVRPSILAPDEYVSVNLGGSVSLMHWMRERGVRNLLFASSSSVYGNNEKVPFSEHDPVEFPISPYAATKRGGELLCHTYHHLFGISVVALRLFTVYGPRQRPDLALHKFADRLSNGQVIPFYGDGSSERAYTHIDDILKGLWGALDYVDQTNPVFEIVNLGESRTVSLSELVETLSGQMGVVPRLERLPPQPGDAHRTHADIAKARRLFGYEPSVSFEDGVSSFLDWLRDRGAPEQSWGSPQK
jgi:UDP-glucuronate 4-epimerase